jgi:hypothetical protein
MPRTTNANRPILAFPMIERDELLSWLRLVQSPELGRGSVRRLLAVFGSPQGVIAAGSEALRNAAVRRWPKRSASCRTAWRLVDRT